MPWAKHFQDKIIKKNQTNPGEPLIAHREYAILNTDFHRFYLLLSLVFLKRNKKKWVFNLMCFMRIYIINTSLDLRGELMCI